ncbi:hypothetical protein BTUL_0182g00070 [Botrytis tulipae]|uniref:Uncharacterized protein n=1 Tax=Botrytis tulipae TaxID=87230 RepID=A0A4Z1EC22_9HELO|nr:hypothetical protein BTUL_0182g00070 [Botrytis tulipae]
MSQLTIVIIINGPGTPEYIHRMYALDHRHGAKIARPGVFGFAGYVANNNSNPILKFQVSISAANDINAVLMIQQSIDHKNTLKVSLFVLQYWDSNDS